MRKTALLLILAGCARGLPEWLLLFPGHEETKWKENWAAAVRLGPERRAAPVSAICRRLKSAPRAREEILRALGKNVAALAEEDKLVASRAATDFRLALEVQRGRGEAELSVVLEGGDDVRLSLRGRKLALFLGGREAGETELALDRKRRVELRREADIVSAFLDGREVLRERLVFWDDAPEAVSIRGTDGVAIARVSWAARPAPVRAEGRLAPGVRVAERAAGDRLVLVALRSGDEKSRREAFLEAKARYLRAAKALENSPLYPRTHDGFTVGRHRLAECLYKAGVCALRLGDESGAKGLFARCVQTEIRGPWQERADLELAKLALGGEFAATMDHVYRILYERGRRSESFEEAGKLAMEALARKHEPYQAVFHLKRLDAHIEWLGWPMGWAARFLFALGETYELQKKPREAERVWRALQRRGFRRFPESAAAAKKLKAFSVDRPTGGE